MTCVERADTDISALVSRNPGLFDIIVGTDVIFNIELVEPLLKLLHRVSHRFLPAPWFPDPLLVPLWDLKIVSSLSADLRAWNPLAPSLPIATSLLRDAYPPPALLSPTLCHLLSVAPSLYLSGIRRCGCVCRSAAPMPTRSLLL